jgi:hypothetical protein
MNTLRDCALSWTLRSALALALGLALTACGGGGSSDTAPRLIDLNPLPNQAIVYTSQRATGGITEKIQSLNQQGANGFAYIGSVAGAAQADELFVKAQPSTSYAYRSTTSPNTAAEWLNALNIEGANGYLLKSAVLSSGSATASNIVVKSSAPATFRYQLVAGNFDLSTLNTQGAAGYSYAGERLVGGATYLLFVKKDNSSAVYNYQTQPALNDAASLLSEMNALGNQRYVYISSLFISGSGLVSLYENNSTNSAPTQYVSLPSSGGLPTSELIQKANQQAANGYYYAGDLGLGGGSQIISLFYKGPAPSTHPINGPTFP